MKIFKNAMRTAAVALAFSVVGTLGLTATAATYKPGTIYVNPTESQVTDEYYSQDKIRMVTYGENTIDLVFPRAGYDDITVSTSKKALSAEVVDKKKAPTYTEDGKKVYVSANEYEIPEGNEVTERYYYLDSDGNLVRCYKEDATGRYYILYKYDLSEFDLSSEYESDSKIWKQNDYSGLYEKSGYYYTVDENGNRIICITNDQGKTFSTIAGKPVDKQNINTVYSNWTLSYSYVLYKNERIILYWWSDDEDENVDYVKDRIYVDCEKTKKKVEAYVIHADQSKSYETLYDIGDGKGYFYRETSVKKENEYDNAYEYYYYPEEPDEPDKTNNYNSGKYVNTTGERYDYARATIQLSSTKAGSYTVTVTAAGITKKIKVLVTPYGGGFKTISFAKKKIDTSSRKGNDSKLTVSYSDTEYVKSSVSSGKLKVSGDKSVKVGKLIYVYTDKSGKVTYSKSIKNGGKIKLSKAVTNSKRNSRSYSKDARKNTYVYVSYKDTFTKEAVTYSVVKKHGYKQIKKVVTEPTGKKYTEYLNGGNSANICLWTY